MLIDATHNEETRVAVVDDNRLEEFDYETDAKKQLKGNIYLAKVSRVEPSLQAAFVEYGGNRHGFLAFAEIHEDYYRIPVEDQEDDIEPVQNPLDDDEINDDDSDISDVGGDDIHATLPRKNLHRKYKIQEVIKRRQVLLVQVLKEERGNKGAALTTFLSLAGRYCVLMPNAVGGGGVSRKISNANDRKRLKKILSELNTPDTVSLIIRTAGAERSKAEIKRDCDYVLTLWEEIRTKTLESTAPCLIHAESDLISRALRDVFSKDMEEVLIAGKDAYTAGRDFMKKLVPSNARKIKEYKDTEDTPLFQSYNVEQQLAQISSNVVNLRSGGSIVLGQTEALVAIDVNSGKATRERHIEETALNTNLEAAEEIARQLRLRDMAGLVVIDFIDMDDNKHNHRVEQCLKNALHKDRARIQVGKISSFGLLEMSRQRLRPSILESMTQHCHSCGGSGYIPSTESSSMMAIRAIEEECIQARTQEIVLRIHSSIGFYLLNKKRESLIALEKKYSLTITIQSEDKLLPPAFEVFRRNDKGDLVKVEQKLSVADDAPAPRNRRSRGRRGSGGNADGDNRNDRGNRRNGRNRNQNRNTDEPDTVDNTPTETETENTTPKRPERDTDGDNRNGRNRRRRRGGRNRNRGGGERENNRENRNDNRTENRNNNQSEPTADNKPAKAEKTAKKATTKKSSAKKTTAKKATAKKAVAKKATAKKATAKKATAKKTTAKKATTKKATAKKAKAKKAKASKA